MSLYLPHTNFTTCECVKSKTFSDFFCKRLLSGSVLFPTPVRLHFCDCNNPAWQKLLANLRLLLLLVKYSLCRKHSKQVSLQHFYFYTIWHLVVIYHVFYFPFTIIMHIIFLVMRELICWNVKQVLFSVDTPILSCILLPCRSDMNIDLNTYRIRVGCRCPGVIVYRSKKHINILDLILPVTSILLCLIGISFTVLLAHSCDFDLSILSFQYVENVIGNYFLIKIIANILETYTYNIIFWS